MRHAKKKCGNRRAVWAAVGAAAAIALLASCGPKCPEVKSALAEDEVTKEDVSRVNVLVEKRKEAMAEAEKGEGASVPVSKLKFSVTAYELAIEAQARVIHLSPNFDASDLWAANRALFDDMRCYFDGLVAEDAPLVISDSVGRDIQRWSQKIADLLKTQGKLSSYELRETFEKGIMDRSKEGEGEE